MEDQKHTYEMLALEVESLKTKKKVFLEKLGNIRINCELKKSKLESFRKRYVILQKECTNIQNRVIALREGNKVIQEELALLEEIRFNLENEMTGYNSRGVSTDDRIESLIMAENGLIKDLKSKIGSAAGSSLSRSFEGKEKDILSNIDKYQRKIMNIKKALEDY